MRAPQLMCVAVALALFLAGRAGATEDGVTAALKKPEGAAGAVSEIRQTLVSNPQHAVDRLNEDWMAALLAAKQYAAVEEFAIAGTLAAPADTWRIEQLLKNRVRALLDEGKPKEALSAAKGLFEVAGMHFTPEILQLLSECLKAAHPEDPGIVPKFKLQQLAGAQEDPNERQRLLAKYGGNSVMDAVPADAAPWAKAIEQRKGKEEYKSLCERANLLLLSGRVKEARPVVQKLYEIAPQEELKTASEFVAKLLKAEDGAVGRANEYVIAIRPKE